MKLINADKIQQQLEKKKSGIANGRYTEGFNDALLKFKSMIHSAKPVDAVPVVYGHWVEVTEDWESWLEQDLLECSVCGERCSGDKKPNYCSNCGANMEEKQCVNKVML